MNSKITDGNIVKRKETVVIHNAGKNLGNDNNISKSDELCLETFDH